jgi:hypothetical protein
MELRKELAGNDGGSGLLIQLHFFVVFVPFLCLSCGRLSVSFDCIIRLRFLIPNSSRTLILFFKTKLVRCPALIAQLVWFQLY